MLTASTAPLCNRSHKYFPLQQKKHAHTETHQGAQHVFPVVWSLGGLVSFAFAGAFWNFAAYNFFIRYWFTAHQNAYKHTHRHTPCNPLLSIFHSYRSREAWARPNQSLFVILCCLHTCTHWPCRLFLLSQLTFTQKGLWCGFQFPPPLYDCASSPVPPTLLHHPSGRYFSCS